jgi:hypothetical protein
MILDNVDDIEIFFTSRKRKQDEPSGTTSVSLAAYVPQSRNGTILITSRNKDAAAKLAEGYKNIGDVWAMDEGQGLQLFRNKLKDTSMEGAIALLRALDYIPLAITQAAACIYRRARMTAVTYLDEFYRSNRKRESLLNSDTGDLRRDLDASNSVVTTWQMSFERIRDERPSAADLLSLMSFFNPQGIPESILRRYIDGDAELGDKDEAENQSHEDLYTLQAYSLVTMTVQTAMCEMHALVQFCTRIWQRSFSDEESWKRKFIGLLAREFPRPDFRNWEKCRQLLPHIESLYNMELSENEYVKAWALTLNNAARYMEAAEAKYADAEKLAERALRGSEKELGADDMITLFSRSNLAMVLNDQGKYHEAEKLHRCA